MMLQGYWYDGVIDKHPCSSHLTCSGGPWGFFGWHTIPAGSTTIVITEGEFDAMAVHQATGMPAISLPNGASLTHHQVPRHAIMCVMS